MHKLLVYAAFGWLVLTGVLHFVIDVAAPWIGGQKTPGIETTLYYGLNTAFALGQALFGLLGLLTAWRAIDVLRAPSAIGLSLVAALGWLAISVVFLDHWEPKVMVAVFGVLVIAAAVTG